MVSLVCVRHGQSRANERKLFAGQTDVPLSALGVRQARELGQFILENYRVDAVCSSDLRRAYDTVAPVAEALRLPVLKERALREIDGGAWEGKPAEEIAREFAEDYGMWREDIGACRCTGGESTAELQKRAVSAVLKIAAENEGKNGAHRHACLRAARFAMLLAAYPAQRNEGYPVGAQCVRHAGGLAGRNMAARAVGRRLLSARRRDAHFAGILRKDCHEIIV